MYRLFVALFILTATFSAQLFAQEDKVYSRFDFVPGEQILYVNQFDTDPPGELPIGWQTNGSGEVIQWQQRKWVKLLQNAVFLTDNQQSFSGDFTVEFDLFLDFRYQDALFPSLSFGLVSTGTDLPHSPAALQNLLRYSLLAVDLGPGVEQNSWTRLASLSQGSDYFSSGEKLFKPLEKWLQQTIHVSMQVQQGRFRIWLNEHKLFDVPQAIPPGAVMNQLFFRVFESSYTNEQVGVYVTAIKVAKGLPDNRHKLLTEGRFSTTGILFDVNSAVIWPVSAGTLAEIAGILKSNPGLRVRIVGHTDADGSDADNLALSRRRSEAVKQKLVTAYGIDAAALLTDGKGEAEPVADNQTREGKARNRRVEFIRL